MEPTTRATSHARTNREQPVVTRHGLRSSHAATPVAANTPRRALRQNQRDRLNISRGQFPIRRPTGEKFHSTSPRRRHRRAALTGGWSAGSSMSSATDCSGRTLLGGTDRTRRYTIALSMEPARDLREDIRRIGGRSGRFGANYDRFHTPQSAPHGRQPAEKRGVRAGSDAPKAA
jgi:hypothetical protein